jgi:RHS repeat-associated protein
VTYAATDLDGTELYEFAAASPVYLESNSHNDVTWTHDESGTPTSHAAYDPFGNLVAGSTTLSATRWQSSYQDDSTGLYYVIARWYAPTLGRFLSDDPLTADATTPEARNPYPYAAGDPIDGSDPSGQSTLCNSKRTSCQPDTSLVGLMHEPYDWLDICGPGSLRVMLAFVVGPAWNYAEGESLIAGTPIWGYRFSENAKTEHKWKPNEVAGDPDGPASDPAAAASAPRSSRASASARPRSSSARARPRGASARCRS